MEPLLSPSNFVGIENIAHLCTGREAPWLSVQASVYKKFARRKSAEYVGRQKIYAEEKSCRNKMGQLWHVDGQRVSFMPSAAEGMSWVARGVDWHAGDNIVTTSLEFPSVAYAWRDLRARGGAKCAWSITETISWRRAIYLPRLMLGRALWQLVRLAFTAGKIYV